MSWRAGGRFADSPVAAGHCMDRPVAAHTVLTTLLAGGALLVASGQDVPRAGRFTASVDVVNVTVTVSDEQGRAVTGLTRDDFLVLEDGRAQDISYFANERVPVSLGLAVDTSGSMEGEKLWAAREALDRFLFDLLGPEDEVFLYRIADAPDLMERWTRDRRSISRALRRVEADGGTALHDTVALAAPLAQTGAHRKKALLIISDGNDTNSETPPTQVRQIVRRTEVIVYAIGIDGRAGDDGAVPRPRWPRQPPTVPPFPVPGRQAALDLAALQAITDDTGGRTEVVRGPRDLAPATARIAAELNQQYSLGYVTESPKDGRWHDIEVRVRNGPQYSVRHRRGFTAQP